MDPATGLLTFHKLPSNIPAALRNTINPQEGTVPVGIISPDRNNFALRMRLALRPFGENTVVRAKFGIFCDNTNLNELQFTRLVPPTEQVRVQFRAEIFNLFNYTNFGQPIADINSPQVGQILSASDPGRFSSD